MSRNGLFISAGLAVAILQSQAQGMGLRSFVALPLEKGGAVLRGTVDHNTDTDSNTFMFNAAYGISHQQTLLLGIPYRLSASGRNRMGDIGALYRHTVVQLDTLQGTDRLAFMGGVIVPTDDKRDEAVQAGVVFTHFRDKYEFDVDVLYQQGLGDRLNSARYDLSFQYRVSPSEYPEWGMPHEWYAVAELGGRWVQGDNTTHQITLGLQWVTKRWVIEGGVVQDLNSLNQTQLLFGVRFH